mgnify:CR=1 FL=1
MLNKNMRACGYFWVHVCGYFWVQSLCLLGACLWLGWVHVCGCWVQVCGRLGACMRKLGASFITAEGLPDSR